MMNPHKSLPILGITALVIGFCVGVGTGVLLAPQSGARTRRRLKSLAEGMVEDTAEAVDEVIERGRRLIAV